MVLKHVSNCTYKRRTLLGTIFGPLLFIIFFNPLNSITDYASTRMYADDAMTFIAFSAPEPLNCNMI